MWLSVLSPAAVERAAELTGGDPRERGRFVPSFLDLSKALKQSRVDQTLNTPSIGTLILLNEQVKWLLDEGGLPAAAAKAREGADLIADWAAHRGWAQMFVRDPALRSPVTSTVDLVPELPAHEVSRILRSVGIVDIDGYRGLGRNQLRISSFPSVPTSDIEALLACVDWVAERALA